MNTQEQKERLENEKTILIEELKKISVKDKGENYSAKEVLENSDVNDLEDQALELADFDNNLTITTELQTQLQEVEIALEKIEKGEYGKCEVCGEDISEQRLMVLPSASTCREHMEVDLEEKNK
jgi:DnaK suppressor protein